MPEAISATRLAETALADRGEELRWAAARLPLAGDAEAVHDCQVALRRLREVWRAFDGYLAPSPEGQRRELRRLESTLRPLHDAESRLDLLSDVLGTAVGESAGEVLADAPPGAARSHPGLGRSVLRGRELEARRALAEATAAEAAQLRDVVVSRRLLRAMDRSASVGQVSRGDTGDPPAARLARSQLPRLFAAAARRHRGTAQLRRRWARVRRLRYRLEMLAPALPDQYRVVLAELDRVQALLLRFNDLAALVEWIDLAAKRSHPDLRPALRRLVVRTELEEEVAREAAELELASLDAGGWWRTAAIACLPERRRTRVPGRH